MDRKTAEISSQTGSNYILACKSVAEQIQEKEGLSSKAIFKIVKAMASKYRLSTLPKNESIIEHLPNDSYYRKVLMVRPIKTASGIAIITVMPKPFECPQGRCIYCPGGIEFNTPLSYIGTEPSTRSAQKFGYDPYRQVQSMLCQLRARGHDTGKVELVIVGGTFPFMPVQYQKDFAKSCFDALNEIIRSANLQEAIISNETAKNRCVGFTVETKPDYCKQQQVDLLLELGVTRIEIGVQSLRDEVYKAVNRGHTLEDVIESFQIARDAGYKIVAHMMPGLPNSSPEKDIEDFKTLFENPNFKPDMLKIYPTLVVKHTGLYKLYMQGKYHPYSDNDLMDVLFAVKKTVPPWVRIMRVQREIEPKDIVAGPKSGNLRQLVLKKLHKMGLRCKCIRCRETGLQRRYLSDQEITMNRIDYLASNGLEVFLSFESVDKLTILGFLRLRKVMGPCRKELKEYDNDSSCAAVVRELHVYGQMLDVGKTGDKESSQHKGYGLQLMQEAERITKEEFGVQKLSVISAVGTREYYKKLGYTQNGPYVCKML
ncbi:MAG: tRNA uridine(34) 5-carboxymethylaminomethyl modification radical SAM/GNAT enzyme Elp3 [Nitrososphaeraceae archaeon]